MVDKKKRSCGVNTVNAGFFGGYDEGSAHFTLPSGHLVCDYNATGKWTRHYCEERGKFDGSKFTFDSSTWSYMNELYGNKVSTLLVSNGSACIMDCFVLPTGLDYAISGVPIMREGEDVIFKTYVRGQGWGSGSLYATWHTFVGLKKDGKTIYVMGMKTKSINMITTAEAYKKFKALGMYDVIKLDGGGSFWMNIGGKIVATSGDRQINTIIKFDIKKEEKNPYKEPSRVLRLWNAEREGNRWLQWELNRHGYSLVVDGHFGTATNDALKSFQKEHKLTVDGLCGPATRAELKKDP